MTKGSIFVIDFDMNSRGAAIQWLSQYPHEEELLFPPCTGLACTDACQRGAKRCLAVSAQVSTARLDTRELAEPATVPGTADAVKWATQLLGCSAEELAAREEWDLSGKNLSALEHVEKLALLVGRAARTAAPVLRSLKMDRCQLTAEGFKLLAAGLACSRLTSVRCALAYTRSAPIAQCPPP